MSGTGSLAALAVAVFVTGAAPLEAVAQQAPTVTPTAAVRRESSLPDYAGHATLDRSSGQSEADGELVVTNDTVRRLREQGSLTTVTMTPIAVRMPSLTPTARPSRRSYWRRRVLQQRDAVAAVAYELSLADARIRALEDAAFAGGRGAARLWARVDEAKKRRALIVERHRQAQENLAAIIRAARQEGAQPGWFR